MPFTLDRTVSRVATPVRPSTPARPGRRVGRATGPQARPERPLRAPRTIGGVGAQGCSSTAAPAPSAAHWRITDRGIAVVLVAGMMIMVAALVVVGLTALRVTGDGYVAHTQAQSALR